MRFRFRLERMLHFVRLRESMKKMEIASLRQLISAAEQRRKVLEKTVRTLLEQSRDRLAESAAWIPYQISQIRLDTQESLRLEKSILADRATLDAKQEELGRISMRRKALESLKEKRQKEFSLDQSRRVQKQMDEAYRVIREEKGS